MTHNLLDIKNITIAYDDTVVLDGFSLRVSAGESVAVTGTSGCGKSSLLKAIVGISPLTKGEIYMDDTALSPGNAHWFRSKVAYLPQELSFPCEWVSELIHTLFGLKANRGRYDRDKFMHYINRLGLEEHIVKKRLSEISGGQRQRLMIAATMLLERRFILLDEPTSALDRDSVKAVADVLLNLEYKPGIIAVTHDEIFARRCDKSIDLGEWKQRISD